MAKNNQLLFRSLKIKNKKEKRKKKEKEKKRTSDT